MMEKALKERIIGAIVLVAVAVLVVPVFLDGPPAESEMTSERVPMPGQGEQKNQTVVLDRDRDDPVPAQSIATAERVEPATDGTTDSAPPVQAKPEQQRAASNEPQALPERRS